MTLKSAVQGVPSNPTGPLQGDPPRNIPRDQWDRPRIVPYSRWKAHPDVWYEPVGMTRASTLGGTCEDQWGLGDWRTGLAVVAATQSEALILRGRLLSPSPADKKARAELGRDALTLAESNAAASVGTSMHHLADRVNRGQSIPDVGEYNVTVNAYRRISALFTFHAIETFCVNEELSSAGTPDRLVSPNGRMVAPDGQIFGPDDVLIWDLKTSSTSDYFGIKFCVQFTVYAGGRPYTHLESRSIGRGKAVEVRGRYGDWTDYAPANPSQTWGLICHAPSGEDIAVERMLHWVPLIRGKELAVLSNTVREARKEKLIVPAGLPTAQKPEIDRLVTKEDILVLINESTTEDHLLGAYNIAENLWDDECDRVAIAKHAELTTPIPLRQIQEAQDRESSLDTLILCIKTAKSEEVLYSLWEHSQLSWTEECNQAASARHAELVRPTHVAKLQLISKIKNVQTHPEMTLLWTQYGESTIWDEDCDRMAKVVMRKL